MVKVKIIATLGPSSRDHDVVKKMVREGAAGFRINCAHGDEADWLEYVKIVREVSSELDQAIPLILDTPGPQVRSGDFQEFKVVRGDKVLFSMDPDAKEGKHIVVPAREFYSAASIGDTILYGDGEVSFRVSEVGEGFVEALALNEGVVKPRKKVVVEGKEYDVLFPSETDRRVFKFSSEVKASFVALSYVRRQRDVEVARDILAKHGWVPGLIAKIETRSGFNNMGEIIRLVDGVMVARGDLGLHFPLEELPLIQERIVREAVRQGRVVIVATEVLESMIENPRPSRSDVVDLYNSVKDLVDAVLFTNETAVGKYPVEVVKWARKIIDAAESSLSTALVSEYRSSIEARDLLDKYVQGLVLLAESLGGVIVGYSRSGRMPTLLSKYRPQIRIYVGVGDKLLAEKLSLRYGLNIVDMSRLISGEDEYERGVRKLLETLVGKGHVRPGDIVVETYAKPRDNMHEIRISQLQ
ncbi:pyruvate kinase [Desulfurococcus mucosus DSM 2162]|uniref:Pyruvate kinase n=1 Tax=Desulfurococcus mucosus (strain ATCC 35584 / DSM 2162 / JCM 9187 / O7/1) TaxID=765177 RepID=E8R768_DESM0|nr:pyruvate kinase [Desulfurococcus mucosus]ADV65533.1 pyruvate kinase [Desulfurococcus mucosus DSM 2162]